MNTLNHPVFGQVNYTAVPMSANSDSQVKQAIGQMSRYVLADSQTPMIQAEATRATEEAGGDPIKGAFEAARKRLRFTEDSDIVTAHGVVEVLIRPVDVCLLSDRSSDGIVLGDCDDFSMYVAALLTAQAVPCCFATVAADPRDPSAYSHVYVVAYPQEGRKAVDASHGKFTGWEAPNRFGKMREWDLVESAGSSGVGGSGAGFLVLLGLAAFGYWYVDMYGWPDVFGGLVND